MIKSRPRLLRLTAALLASYPLMAAAQVDCETLTAAACSHTLGDASSGAVVGVSVAGGATCSGSLLARTNGSRSEMGILMAEHCVPTNVTAGQTVSVTVFFNALGACVDNANLRSLAESAQTRLDTSGTLLARDKLIVTRNADGTTTSSGTDSAFVIANAPAPSGAYYAGWNATALPANRLVEGIGHGRGKQQTLASGQSQSNPQPNLNFFQVLATRGLIVGGHSGSPVFNNSSQVVGVMSDAVCSSGGKQFIASRFEKYYPMFRSFLDPAGSGVLSISGYPADAGSGSSGGSSSSSGSSTGGLSGGGGGGGGSVAVLSLLALALLGRVGRR